PATRHPPPATPEPPATPRPGPWDGYLTGPENTLAQAGAVALARGEGSGVSPLVVHGPSGAGKSRLLAGVVGEGWGGRVAGAGAGVGGGAPRGRGVRGGLRRGGGPAGRVGRAARPVPGGQPVRAGGPARPGPRPAGAGRAVPHARRPGRRRGRGGG